MRPNALIRMQCLRRFGAGRPIPRKFRLFTRGTRYRGAVLLSSVALRRICQRMTNARDMEPVAEPAGPLSSHEQLLPPAECDGHR